MNKTLTIGTITIVLLAFALVGLFLWQMQSTLPPVEQTPPLPAPSPQSQAEVLDTSTWQTYRNAEYGFEMKYPPGWSVETLYPSDVSVERAPGVEFKKLKDEYASGQIIVHILSHPNPKRLSLKEFLLNGDINLNHPLIGEYATPEDEKAGRQMSLARMTKEIFQRYEALHDGRFMLYVNTGTYVFTFYLQSVEADNAPQLFDQILSTFRFVDILNEIKKQLSLDLEYIVGFRYGVGIEQIGELRQVEDINNDGSNELFVTASGAGGTCVGGTNYKVLYSTKDQEYFIAARSFLESLPTEGKAETFCPIVNKNQTWAGCGDGYIDYVCFSNNLKEEKNAAFKEYLEKQFGESN